MAVFHVTEVKHVQCTKLYIYTSITVEVKIMLFLKGHIHCMNCRFNSCNLSCIELHQANSLLGSMVLSRVDGSLCVLLHLVYVVLFLQNYQNGCKNDTYLLLNHFGFIIYFWNKESRDQCKYMFLRKCGIM